MYIALLVARLFFGLAMAGHGLQKLAGWYGGHGLKGTGEFMAKIGFPWSRFFAFAAGMGETASGLLLALGLFTPFAAALMIVVMVTAALTVHLHNGFFSSKNGVEMPMLYAMAALLFAQVGPGPYSFDEALGLAPLYNERVTWLVLGLAVVLGFANYTISRLMKASAMTPTPRHT